MEEEARLKELNGEGSESSEESEEEESESESIEVSNEDVDIAMQDKTALDIENPPTKDESAPKDDEPKREIAEPDIENSPKHSPKEAAPILDQKEDEKEVTSSSAGVIKLLNEVKKLTKVVQQSKPKVQRQVEVVR